MIDGGVGMGCYVDFVELIRDRHHFLFFFGFTGCLANTLCISTIEYTCMYIAVNCCHQWSGHALLYPS